MADPIPVNSRRERNPQPTVTPFGNPPFGGLPPRPNPAANQGGRTPLQRAVDARLGNAPPANRYAPQGALFERRQPRRRRESNENILHIVAGVVLILIVVLSYVAQSPPSEATAYQPRGETVAEAAQVAAVTPLIQVAAAAPTATVYSPTRWDWIPAGTASGVTAWVIERTLIRACPNDACIALNNPTILEVGLFTDIVALDPTRSWVQVNAARPDGSLGSGWVPLTAIRPNGDLNSIPVVAV